MRPLRTFCIPLVQLMLGIPISCLVPFVQCLQEELVVQVLPGEASESSMVLQLPGVISGPDINNQLRRIVSEENLFLIVHCLADRDSSHLLYPGESGCSSGNFFPSIVACRYQALIGLPVQVNENRKGILEQLPCKKRKKMGGLYFCNHGKWAASTSATMDICASPSGRLVGMGKKRACQSLANKDSPGL